ncbi:MAG: hypothetical protein Kow0065_01900 [Methylomicrobium sp.]
MSPWNVERSLFVLDTMAPIISGGETHKLYAPFFSRYKNPLKNTVNRKWVKRVSSMNFRREGAVAGTVKT